MIKRMICLGMLLALSLSVFAQKQEKQSKSGNSKGKQEKAVNSLKLSEEQKKQVQTIKEVNKVELESLRTQMAQKQADLRVLESKEQVDIAAVHRTIDEMATIFSKRSKAKADERIQIREILSAEQRVKYDAKIKNRQEKYRNKQRKPEKKLETIEELEDTPYFVEPDIAE